MRKIKRITIVVMLLLFLLLMAFFIITADEDERPTPDQVGIVGLNLSEEVLAYQGIVAQYAEENGLSEYIQYLLAIMQRQRSLPKNRNWNFQMHRLWMRVQNRKIYSRQRTMRAVQEMNGN